MNNLEKQEKKNKCTFNGKDLSPCWVLSAAFEPTSSKKGLMCPTFFNLKKMKPSSPYAMVKSGDFAKKGIVLNYCPFCGEDIKKEAQ